MLSQDDSAPALDLDTTDDTSMPTGDQSSDSGQDQSGGADSYNNALNTVSDILSFGRQKYGIGQQVAGNIPAAPAGPGGEGQRTSPSQQPFQPAPGGVPFGRRNQSFDDGGAVNNTDDFNEDTQGAYNPGGPDPVGAVLSNALDGAGSAVQGVANAAAPYTAAPMSPMEAGQGETEAGALQRAGGALSSLTDGQGDRPSEDNPLSPSSLRTALDPSTFHQNMANIIRYLRGSDAAPAPAAQQAEAQVDPQGQMDPGTRKLLAIDAVQKQYGPQAAWSLMQHYRTKYDAYKAFAAAANAGTQGKPRDPAAAAMAMQQAYDHLPDGQNLTVKPSGAGFTATVTGPNGKAQTVSLSPQAFHQLTQGPDGQFDNVIEKGLPNVLTKFVRNNGLSADQVKPDTSTSAPEGSEPYVPRSGGSGGSGGNDLGFDQQLRRRAMALFPGVGQQAQRIQWMAAQEQQGRENDINEKKIDTTLAAVGLRGQTAQAVQNLKNSSTDKRTDAYSTARANQTDAYRQRTLSTADTAKLNAAQRSSDARMRDAANIIGRAIGAGQMYDPKNVADATVQKAAALLGIGLGGGQGQPAPAQQGQQGGEYQPAPPVNQRQTNTVYKTPKGPARWMGNGWQPIQ